MIKVEIFLVAALLIFFVYKIRRRRFSMKISQFDGPRSLPIIGNSMMLRGSPTECFQILHNLFRTYSDRCYRLWFFNEPFVISGRREDVQVVSKMRNKPRQYDFFKHSLGAGIVLSNGEKWKRSRIIMEATFAAKELSTNILRIFNEQADLLVDEIKHIGMGVECNLWPLILRVKTRTISETTIGSANKSDLNISEGYGHGSKKCETLIIKRMYSPWLYPEFIFKIYLFLTNQSHIFKTIRTPFLKAIQRRKKIAMKEKTSSDKTSEPNRTLILDLLLKSKDLTDQDLTDEIMTLMFAGSDTSATTICFTLLMLAMNPIIQEKVYEEIHNVTGNKDSPLDASDLSQLNLLEQCIKETLRKFSIVPLILRHASTDIILSDGRVLPAGANIILSIYEIHNNPEYYPNPEKWNPHNFDPDKVASRPVNTFIPFAVGSRMCVGYKYAMMSMKVFLFHVLRNFKLSTNQTEHKINFNILVKCTNGYHVKFEQRMAKIPKPKN